MSVKRSGERAKMTRTKPRTRAKTSSGRPAEHTVDQVIHNVIKRYHKALRKLDGK